MLRIYLFSILLITTASLCAEQRVYTLNADDWARPRSGQSLIEFEALRDLMRAWAQVEHAVIEIYYPGGEMGSLWAEELRDWLVAMGIPSEYIRPLPGSGRVDRIELIIKAAD